MGAVTVEQQKLVLNTFAMTLQNALVTADIVTWNEMDGELDDRNGLAVLEQTTPRYNVTRTEGGVKDLSAGTDGTVFGSELFQITGTFNANMGWGDFVKIKSIGEARESEALLGAADSLATKIDAYILQIAALASADWTGTAGVANVGDWNTAESGYTRLKENGVLSDAGMAYVLNYTDKQALGANLTGSFATGSGPTAASGAGYGLGKEAYRNGYGGQLGGVDALFTNQLPVLTTGTRSATAMLVNGAAQNVNYSAVAKAGTVNGRRLTQNLICDGVGAGATVKAGEVFSFTAAGTVLAYDPRKGAPVQPARNQQFTVVADATADGSGNITLVIFPAIVVPGSGTGDDININTAHATVSAAPADNAALTFLGAPSANLAPRMILQKQAIVVNTIPLIMPSSDTAMRRKLKRIPLSVRMWAHSDFNTGVHGVRFDVAMNANIRERMRVARING